ncbi:YncE family protein [Pseudochelatococcus lubricantis]|uniref:YncE family protein n=1 Tax=Pseudochelatococcus lubricantis TaxID=1538102 RepID=UPI0035ED96F8
MTSHMAALAKNLILLMLAGLSLGIVASAADVAAASTGPRIETSARVAPGEPYEIVFNPADSDLYVAAYGHRPSGREARVVRLDGKTLQPKAELDVGGYPVFGLGINTRTQTLYGTNTRGGGLVQAFDLRTGKLAATIRRDGEEAHVRAVVVDEEANKIYVSVVGFTRDGTTTPSQIWVIDGATNTIERVIDVDTKTLTGLALDAAGNRIFATGLEADEVVAVDLRSGQVTARWPTGSEWPTNIAFDKDGQRLFVTGQKTGDLAVLDARTGAILTRIPTGESALAVAFNPAVRQIYVTNRKAGTVTVIDSTDYKVLANLKTGSFPQSIAIDHAAGRVFVTNKPHGLPRDASEDAPTPYDPDGDTVTVIRP